MTRKGVEGVQYPKYGRCLGETFLASKRELVQARMWLRCCLCITFRARGLPKKKPPHV